MRVISNFILLFYSTVSNLLKVVFASDTDVMSNEVRQIMSNPKDRKKFMEAIDRLKTEGSSEETITLSDNSTLTLVP
jgi:acetone carboxylase gamma subunit